jgi:isochorismate hydrolase
MKRKLVSGNIPTKPERITAFYMEQESIPDTKQKQAKPSQASLLLKELLKYWKSIRVQIRQLMGLLTGHCHLVKQPFKLEEVNNPIRWKC